MGPRGPGVKTGSFVSLCESFWDTEQAICVHCVLWELHFVGIAMATPKFKCHQISISPICHAFSIRIIWGLQRSWENKNWLQFLFEHFISNETNEKTHRIAIDIGRNCTKKSASGFLIWLGFCLCCIIYFIKDRTDSSYLWYSASQLTETTNDFLIANPERKMVKSINICHASTISTISLYIF